MSDRQGPRTISSTHGTLRGDMPKSLLSTRNLAATLLGGWLAMVALSWPALVASLSNDDDQWLTWARQPFPAAIAAGTPYATFRPAFATLLWAEVRVFDGWLPGYRLVGLSFHLVAAALVLACARRVLGDRAALLAALLFLFAGVHHETLFWIAGRPDALSGTMVLACTWLYLRQRERPPGERSIEPLGASAAAFIAPLFKETGLAVVPLLLAVALALPSERRDRRRDLRLALKMASPAFVSFGLYVVFSTTTGRFSNALQHVPGRSKWIVPGIVSLVYPLPLTELAVMVAWKLGPILRDAFAVLGVVAAATLIWLARRRLDTRAARLGLAILVPGMLAFLLLSQHRLLYLASAGFAILAASSPRRKFTLVIMATLIGINAFALHRYASRWNAAGDAARRVLEQIQELPEDRIALVDFPLDIGEVLAPASLLAHPGRNKKVQLLAPLRLDGESNVPSSLLVEDGRLVIRRPIRWEDHLSYACDAHRMPASVLPVEIGPCRSDAPLSLSVSQDDLEGVAIYRYEAGRLVKTVAP